jgi:uncharacterized protein (DUF1330 family)
MKAYLIADISVHDKDKFNEYLRLMPECVNTYGGKYLVKGGDPTSFEGEWQPEVLVVIEFPSKEKLNQFTSDSQVQALFTIRQKATDGQLILVNGCE